MIKKLWNNWNEISIFSKIYYSLSLGLWVHGSYVVLFTERPNQDSLNAFILAAVFSLAAEVNELRRKIKIK